MLKHSIFVFIIGWVLWFATEKHPASLGVIVPGESGNLLGNFQMAFDMMKAGYLKAAYIFIWKAHYIVLSLIAGLMSSIIFQAAAKILRQRKLREVMRPEILTSNKTDSDE